MFKIWLALLIKSILYLNAIFSQFTNIRQKDVSWFLIGSFYPSAIYIFYRTGPSDTAFSDYMISLMVLNWRSVCCISIQVLVKNRYFDLIGISRLFGCIRIASRQYFTLTIFLSIKHHAYRVNLHGILELFRLSGMMKITNTDWI